MCTLPSRTRSERNLVDSYGDEICSRYLLPTVESILRNRGLKASEINQYKVTMNLEVFHKYNVLDSLHDFISISDLESGILINNSKIPFISSDSPVIFNNQIHLDAGFTALFSRGLQIHCPISPNLYLLLYDPDFYSIDGNKIIPDVDINRLNALQLLHCNEILILSDDIPVSYLEALERKFLKRRKTRMPKIKTIISELQGDGRRNDIDTYTIENANTHMIFDFLRFNYQEFKSFRIQYLKAKKVNPLIRFPRNADIVKAHLEYRKSIFGETHIRNPFNLEK